MTIQQLKQKASREAQKIKTLILRRHLSYDALTKTLRNVFAKVPDLRGSNSQISLVDTLMCGFAVFSLKDPSLLAFDRRRCCDSENLQRVYGVESIPCDSQMRTILDQVSPEDLRRPFRSVMHDLQRGKVLNKFLWLGKYYLLALDGTGIYSSKAVKSDACLVKHKSDGSVVEYYQQMLAGAIVHPDLKEVVPLCPEMIIKQDGQTKNDCERNAAKRYVAHLRREHPHMPFVVIEDALSSNAPHISELRRHDLRYILGVKPGDHSHLFEYVEKMDQQGRVTNLVLEDPDNAGNLRCFRWIHDAPLNQGSEILVNFLEYWEVREREGVEAVIEQHFSWVTDLDITEENVHEIMRGGRVRWRIENETFNTLKNQGYHLEHNYGLGKKHLSAVFTFLTMLAFLVDQVQQLCCPLFQAARARCGSKRCLWEYVRGAFHWFEVHSMELIHRAIVYGNEKRMLCAVT